MSGRVELTGGKRRALHGRFEPVVVTVGTTALDDGDPTEHRTLG
jgi:hypothetical protein